MKLIDIIGFSYFLCFAEKPVLKVFIFSWECKGVWFIIHNPLM